MSTPEHIISQKSKSKVKVNLEILVDMKEKALKSGKTSDQQAYFEAIRASLSVPGKTQALELNRRVDKIIAEKLTKMAYFNDQISLSETQQKYCRCILHVASDQPDWCLEEGFPGSKEKPEVRDGRTCYNPYAICTKTISRRGLVECFLNYNLDGIPPKEVGALVYLKQKLLKKNGLPMNLSGLRRLQSIIKKNGF